jgi:4a-hydroxytetrahydrobiopterin dehydratase
VATLLDDAELEAALATLVDWHGDTSAITRVVTISADKDAGLRSDLDKIAREMNHDPDLTRSGDDLHITMSTHSAGGVTELDIEYARRVDVLLSSSHQREDQA